MVTYSMTSVIPDPLLFMGSCCAKWIRIRIIMMMAILWSMINLGMSGWLYMSYTGEIDTLTFPDGTKYTDWQKQICEVTPYMELSPFAFVFTESNGYTSSTQTTCGYSSTNSIIRFVIGSLGVVLTAILYFKTPISVFARQIWFTLGVMYFVVFILDCNDTQVGSTTCRLMFPNTSLNTELLSKNISVSCDNSNYAGLAVIDAILVASFFMLHTSWALCKDLYVVKK